MEGLPSLAALVELPALSAPVTIRTAFGFLFKALGVPKDTPRASLPYAIPATAAVSLLQLLSTNLPEDVSLQEVAAAMSPAGVRSYPTDQQVQLDALLGLSCLLSSGSMQDKLQLCFWALDKDSSGSLDLEQLLGLIPGAHLVSCAARILLQESALQGLVEEADDPRAAALTQQASAVLREVLTRAFLEADPHGTGLIQPGEQLMQLLFAAAAQLTSILVGAAPSLQEGVPGGFGSSYASSTSTTPSRSTSASLLRLQQAADRQQQQPLGQQPPQSHAGRALSQQLPLAQQQQQQQHPAATPAVDPGGSSSSIPPGASASPEPLRGPMADVVIMDSEGGVLVYQTSVEEAAAAACQGRTPNGAAGSSGVGSAGGRGVTLYAPPHASSGVGGAGEASTPRQRLAPATSLLQHLELLEAQQQLQQQQQVAAATTSDSEAGLFLTPGGTASAEEGAAAGGAAHGSPFGQHLQHPHEDQQHLEQQHGSLLHRPQLRAGLSSLHLSGGKSTPGSSANNSLRRIFVGSPFGTISESVKTGGISSGDGARTKEPADNTADAAGNAAPATAAGAITHTATNVMTTIQSNVIAVVVKLLLHCGLCFLVTTMVVLGDAALVTGLHIGAKLPLSVSFAVAVAVNLALVLLLVVLLVVVRHANASNNSRLAEVANSPEAQQLDQILETMKAAVQALKTTEQQQQQQVGLPGPSAGSGSNRFTGSHFLASRASSIRGDLEQGKQQGGAGGLARAPSGPLAVAGKLRAVWSAVGKVAGFLPAAQGSEDALAGPFGSAVQLEGGAGGLGGHSSTSWGVSSGPEGLSTPAGAGRAEPPGQGRATAASAGQPVVAGQAVRPGQQQSRQTRVAGSAAPQAAPGAPPVALKEAYPQL